EPRGRKVEPGRQDDPPVLAAVTGGLPASAEAAPDDLAKIGSAGRDDQLHGRGLVSWDRAQIVVEERQRVAVVLQGHAKRATYIRDRLIGVFAYTLRHVIHCLSVARNAGVGTGPTGRSRTAR